MKKKIEIEKLPPPFIVTFILKIRFFLINLINRMYPAYLVLFEKAQKFWISKAIAVAAELEIADILEEGPKTIEEIARISGTHAPSLYRVMRVLAGEGIFKEKQNKTFTLTPLAKELLEKKSSAKYMVLNVVSPVNWKLFGEMLHCIKTGENATVKTLGADTIFEYLEKDPKENEIYNKSMASTSKSACAAIVSAYDFSKFKNIIDVGGGQGYLISTLLYKNEKLKGVIFDLPHVIKGSDKNFEKFGVSRRAKAIPGSFFDFIPEGADAYLLKNIIHTWDDDHCIQILKNVHKVMVTNGKLLLFETVIKEDNNPSFGKLLDLQMMIATKGGKERTEKEFEELFKKAGFKLTRIIPTAAPLSIIEVVKA